MKKKIAIIIITLCVILITNVVFAVNEVPNMQESINNLTGQNDNKINKNTNTDNIDKSEPKNKQNEENNVDSATSKIVEVTNNEKKTLEDYQQAYGSESYGLTAYILSRIQIYSIPFCFIGIAISAIYQYVLGVRKLDTRDKGFTIMISIITLFVIAQVLPLIFAVVVKGWRG